MPESQIEGAAPALSPFEESVLAELASLGGRRGGWGAALVILAVSLAAFVGTEIVSNAAAEVTALVAVIFVHEVGHALAMRALGYADVRMFFIPLFGAAVSGRSRDAAGWKRAVVALAGPLPGIAAGFGLAVGAAIAGAKSPVLMSVAGMLIFLNGINLAPIFPLDGGRFLQELLFCRSRYLELAFGVAAAAVLALMAVALGAWTFGVLAFLVAAGVGSSFRTGSVAEAMKLRMAAPEGAPLDVPRDVALAMIPEVESRWGSAAGSAKQAAIRIAAVWERMRSRPPGLAATVALLGLYAGAVMATLVALVVYALAFGGAQGG